MDRKAQIDTFNRFTRVSRETISSLVKYEELLIRANKNLNLIGKSTINKIWESFLIKDKDKLKGVMQSSLVDFVFPFRRETIEVLKWADSIISDWKITYFLGLNLWGKNRIDEAIE